MSASLGSKAGVAIRLALAVNYPQLERYVAEMAADELEDLRQAATDLADSIAIEQDRRHS